MSSTMASRCATARSVHRSDHIRRRGEYAFARAPTRPHARRYAQRPRRRRPDRWPVARIFDRRGRPSSHRREADRPSAGHRDEYRTDRSHLKSREEPRCGQSVRLLGLRQRYLPIRQIVPPVHGELHSPFREELADVEHRGGHVRHLYATTQGGKSPSLVANKHHVGHASCGRACAIQRRHLQLGHRTRPL